MSAVIEACAVWAKGPLRSMPSYNRELAGLLVETADDAWSDRTLDGWERAVMRLSLLHLFMKFDLRVQEQSGPSVAEQILTTLREARSLAPTPIDSLIVRWTCLFCIARPPRRKAVRRNQWADDALKTTEALSALGLFGHAEHLARSLAVPVPSASKLQSKFKGLDDLGAHGRQVTQLIQAPHLLAPQMRAGISTLVRYLSKPPGHLEIAKTPKGVLQVNELRGGSAS